MTSSSPSLTLRLTTDPCDIVQGAGLSLEHQAKPSIRLGSEAATRCLEGRAANSGRTSLLCHNLREVSDPARYDILIGKYSRDERR